MKKLYLIITVLFLSFLSFSQNQECGTVPTQSQIDYLNQTRNARQNWNNSESIINLPVQHHIIRESNAPKVSEKLLFVDQTIELTSLE